MRFQIAIALIAYFILASCGSQGQQPADRLVDIGTHRLHIHCEGKGSPTVVIDTGLGDQAENWRSLQDRLAQHALVCAYDRAGYGQSEPGPLPRSSDRIADELHALLRAAELPGPYVLVGHSLGGLNMQVFASKYPNRVAGLVLLDPPPLSFILRQTYPGLQAMADSMTAEWEAAAARLAQVDDPDQQAQAAFLATIASEHAEMFGQSAKPAAAIETFDDLPFVVIASGRPNPMFGEVAEEYQKYWADQCQALAKKSSLGRYVFAEESSHFLYVDEPDLVYEAILFVVGTVR
jgi:pimeloyl-ACP methyl ester carboxylesterase